MSPGFGFVIMLGMAVFFYKVAEIENLPALLWGGISLGTWLVTSMILHWGTIGCFLGQALIFAAMIGWNFLRDR